MEKILNAIKSLTWKQILATAVLVAAVAVTLSLTSCNVARAGISGDRVVDKNVKDSVHYEMVVEK